MFVEINGIIVNKSFIKVVYIKNDKTIAFRFNGDNLFDEIHEEHASLKETKRAFEDWVNKLCLA